ncbi:MAG: Linear gramicidin synthase subunit D [Pseudomonas sp.]|nr:MAG: Linear gramicidin synthase subunit D [Pseudomonas sp.]
MRRLKIALLGTSPALVAVGQALEPFGHELTHEVPHADLVVEDAGAPDLTQAALMSLRLGIGPLASNGLPALQWRCYTRAGRLFATLDVADEPSGNGQRLRRRALDGLVEWVALHVSGFARDPGYFSGTATASTAIEQDLHGLEPLAYLHRHNRTADPALLALAQTPVIERLEHSLLTFAERTALNIDGRVCTYRQLHAHSLAIQAQLAPLLAAGDHAPIVAVCLGKSVALYAGILAVLGCGAVYLPLEPGHPPGRQHRLLQNAGARVLLDDGEHPLRGRYTALDISAIAPDLDGRLMRTRLATQAPCLVLHTSGTSGDPKGVLLSQHNLAHFCAWLGARMQLDEHSRVLQFSPLSFDSSLIDIFPTLIAGAALIVPSEDQRRDPQQLLELLRQQHVTHAFVPPALLGILPLDSPLGVPHLLTGGEACQPHVIRQLAGHCQLHNLYGPTETTVAATCTTLQPHHGNHRLGTPVANTQVLILDAHLQPVDEHEVGELYIAGPGVGLGYLNLPERTERHYVHLSLPGGETLRAYRSGDLGRWTEQGIELVGRRDLQVKIRGFRVEPQEIERCLQRSGLFCQVAVVIDQHLNILAFVARPEPHASVALLGQHAQQTLADYMQPVAYTVLASLPCSVSGKVDRHALLKRAVEPLRSSAVQPPQTPLQAQLLALWSELLDVPPAQLSTDDSFFNLGGHSILLSTLLLRIRAQFGRSLALNRFFEAPTIRTLAALLGDEAALEVSTSQATHDAQRTLHLPVLPAEHVGPVDKVIVTGANSFVGVHLVEALLAGGAREVACLVRERPGQPAEVRFARALNTYRLAHLDLNRVRVYACDISQPRLGLADDAYEHLAATYGVLVHRAAHVNHVLDYNALAKDNVAPVLECLRLCETGCKKVFNFVSTLSAASSVDASGQVQETHAVATPPLFIRNGYNLSKWVAERLLARAAEQGVWVNIHRPGNISFNSRNGVCEPQKNRLLLMLKGSLQLGLVPQLALNFDLMPVDFLARFIAFHAGRCVAGRDVFNLHNPQPLSWTAYVAAFARAGHVFEQVSVEQWQRQLQRVDHHNALFGVLGFYLEGVEDDIGDISRIVHDNARRGVERMGASYPEKDATLLSKGCEFLSASGFLPPTLYSKEMEWTPPNPNTEVTVKRGPSGPTASKCPGVIDRSLHKANRRVRHE